MITSMKDLIERAARHRIFSDDKSHLICQLADALERLSLIGRRMADILFRARDAIEALDGTTVENEKLVDDYRRLMKEIKS